MQLFDSLQIRQKINLLEDWQKDAYNSFVSKLTNKEERFPCIPATQGFHLNQFRYGFVNNLIAERTSREFADLLKNYTIMYKDIGNYTSLIIFFKPIDNQEINMLDYERLFWNLINSLSNEDEKEWPQEIPLNPNHYLWEFCFHQERFFIYTATPIHQKRQSRSFPYFMVAITPRSVFDQFDKTASSNAIKNKIRERLKSYDNIAPHPALKKYGDANNREAHQYFLRDDQSTISHCPFHRDDRE